MTMLARRFQDMIVRAVHDTDKTMLASIAEQLARCERANEMLRAKGYGSTGMAIDATVRTIPHSRD